MPPCIQELNALHHCKNVHECCSKFDLLSIKFSTLDDAWCAKKVDQFEMALSAEIKQFTLPVYVKTSRIYALSWQFLSAINPEKCLHQHISNSI
jgi:hypothetical protein